jgi:hypothetical protein
MKKSLMKVLLILLLPAAGYSQFTHAGLQAAYSTQVKEPGFGLLALYRVNDAIKLTPNGFYYLPHTINTSFGTQKYEWWIINLDGNYVIVNQGIFEGYGLMGLSFMNITGEQDEVKLGQVFEDKLSMLKLGLNVGAGLRLNLGDRVVPFLDLRYTIGSKAKFSDWGEVSAFQFSIFAGILVRIKEDKDRSAEEEDY